MKVVKMRDKFHYNVKIECNKEMMDKIVELLNGSDALFKETPRGINFKVLPSDYNRILKIYDEFDLIYEICAKDSDILVLSSDKNLYSVLDKSWNTEKTKDGVLRIPFSNQDGVTNNFKNVHTEIEFYFVGKKEVTQKQIPVEDFKVIAIGRYMAVIGSKNVLSAAEGIFTDTVKLRGVIMIPFGMAPEIFVLDVKQRIKDYFNWK
jgi:hypothetical protein